MTKANIINDLYANYLDDRVNGIEALIKAITKESVMLLHDADHAQDFVIDQTGAASHNSRLRRRSTFRRRCA
jgi:hypothetical protein